MGFVPGDVIEGRFAVTGMCSDRGGMGTILHVESLSESYGFPLVLKYCKLDPNTTDGAEGINRFKREVRYLEKLRGNSKIVQVVYTSISHDPPFFVMKYYEDGDLTKMEDDIRANAVLKERVIYAMLDCVAELHREEMFHRDIKPENFLRDGDSIVISDLGLAKMPNAGTTLITTHRGWGTEGYMPPEYYTGGFRDPDAQGDIYMLGKTIYALDTGRDVTHLLRDGVNPSLFHVIQRCCNQHPNERYPSLSALRQDIKLAFDVILGRADQIDRVRQMVAVITSQLESTNVFEVQPFQEMLGALALLDPQDRAAVLHDWPRSFFQILVDPEFEGLLGMFLEQYREFMAGAVTQWSYAETVAANMSVVFRHHNPDIAVRALDIAIEGAISANRYAAMDTCVQLIIAVTESELAHKVSALVLKYPETFVTHIEPSTCKSTIIRNALRAASKS